MPSFVVPGKPFSKQRPKARAMPGGRGAQIYTPSETVSYERQVGSIAAAHFPAPLEGPVRLTVEATFGLPASWSKKKQAAHLGRPHTQGKDLDNCVKAISDALNRIAYADDGQVAELVARKLWGETAETRVTVEALDA